MKTTNKISMQTTVNFLASTMAVLALATALAPGAQAQDAAMEASQQAAQQAMQASQQAAQQATADAQRASQQAMQDSMNATQSTSYNVLPPRLRPTIPVTPHGPVPQQIAAAHTIFVSNLGAAPNAPMDSTLAYEQFARELATWGHYTQVETPAKADLIFELREIAPLTDVSGFHGDVASYNTPAFELHIRDAKTNVVLWTVVSPIEDFGKVSERPHWYALAVSNLVSRVKVVTATPLNPGEIADLTAMPKTHNTRTALIVTGVTVGAAAVGAILLHHAFENDKNSMQQQQDAFCLAHGIPLSECAGG